MEKLVVADVKGDPEFVGFEPQVFDDAVNGKGMRILRYRRSGAVDVYWQPGVRVDRSTFVVGAGIGDFAEAAIEPARLEITGRGVDVHVAFTDAQGRRMELRILEDAPGKRGFPLLAPVGADIRKPLQLFLVYMPDIDLARRAGTLVEGRIGDRPLRPASLPLLLGGHRVLFIRYVARPMIATLNPPMSRPLVARLQAPGSVTVDGVLIVADGDGRVTSVSPAEAPGAVEMEFHPGFPHLPGLARGGSAAGRWSIRITGVPITGGSYSASREGDRVAVELDVTEHWKPSGLPLSMTLFTRVASVFRTWPATYRWRGTVGLGAAPAMSGTWERKGVR
jgi:hypothetical protein